MMPPVAPSKLMVSAVKVIRFSRARAPVNLTIALSRLGLLTVKPDRVPICSCACEKRPAIDTVGAGLPGSVSPPATLPTASVL
jgi:hypothetical protein